LARADTKFSITTKNVMGTCWCMKSTQQKLTTPSISKHGLLNAHFVQEHVLQFVYEYFHTGSIHPRHALQMDKDNHCVAANMCINCGLFNTLSDFIIRRSESHIQFDLPLCADCQIRTLIPHRVYEASESQFRVFYQLDIIRDIIRIYTHFYNETDMTLQLIMTN
jgi:hypothetical protein